MARRKEELGRRPLVTEQRDVNQSPHVVFLLSFGWSAYTTSVGMFSRYSLEKKNIHVCRKF